MEKNSDKIFTTKFYVKIKSDSPLLTCWGVACLASDNVLFIRSTRSLPLDTPVDLEIFSADLRPCFLKGNVTGVMELGDSDRGFGIEIELSGKDRAYTSLLKLTDSRDIGLDQSTLKGEN